MNLLTNRVLRRFAVCAVVVAVLVAAAPAMASHYELVDVPRLVDADARAKLAKVGITTTEQLLTRVAKKADRRAVAKETGIPMKTLTQWARFCDLLRVRGCGPIMVRLLQAGGVPDIAAFAKEKAEPLLVRVTAANAKTRITELLPGVEHLSDWIAQAKAMPIIVE